MITAAQLTKIATGNNYYLSNSTGEIKKAGLWQWFKCWTGFGDGRAKVQRLVDAVKAALLHDASLQSEAELNNELNALDKNHSISGADLKRIATRFTTAHADTIGRTETCRLAENIIDRHLETSVKQNAVHPDPVSQVYMRKLLLYGASPVILKHASYETPEALQKALSKKISLFQDFIGGTEMFALNASSNVRYLLSNKHTGADGKTKELNIPRFKLDEVRFRAILACFNLQKNAPASQAYRNLFQSPEDILEERRDEILALPLDPPTQPDAAHNFATAFFQLINRQ